MCGVRFMKASAASHADVLTTEAVMEALVPGTSRRRALEWLFGHLLALSPALMARLADAVSCVRAGTAYRLRLLPDVECWSMLHGTLLGVAAAVTGCVVLVFLLAALLSQRAPAFGVLRGVQRILQPAEETGMSPVHLALMWAACVVLPWLRATLLVSPYIAVAVSAVVVVGIGAIMVAVLLRRSVWAALFLAPVAFAGLASLSAAVAVSTTGADAGAALGVIALVCVGAALLACAVGAARIWRMEREAAVPVNRDRGLMRALCAGFEYFVQAYTGAVVELAEVSACKGLGMWRRLTGVRTGVATAAPRPHCTRAGGDGRAASGRGRASARAARLPAARTGRPAGHRRHPRRQRACAWCCPPRHCVALTRARRAGGRARAAARHAARATPAGGRARTGRAHCGAARRL
jgi:hypothetical protein